MKTHELTGLNPTERDSLKAFQKQIRVRAYQLYEQRGRENGHDLDDWLQAEWEETRRSARPGRA